MKKLVSRWRNFNSWHFLISIALFLLLSGCGENSSPKAPGNGVFTVAFGSTASLDGSDAANPDSNIWQARTDGSAAVPLTRFPTTVAASVFPAWSPDGKKLAFVSTRALDGSNTANANSTGNLWVMNADGSGATPVTKLTANGVVIDRPRWSPDGGKLVFTSTRALDGSDAVNTNSVANIWVINADGSGAIPVTRLTVLMADPFVWTSQQPVWSPDGKKIAFLSAAALDGSNALNPGQTLNIWVSNADGSGLVPVTKLVSGNGASALFGIAWSPDGNKLAFTSERALDGSDASNMNFAVNLWRVNADGSGAVPLTTHTASGTLYDPVWSPDGSKLAFGFGGALDGSDALNSTDNVWVINADGSGAFPVTKLTASGVHFDPINGDEFQWSPDGSKLTFASNRALDGSDTLNTNGRENVWVINADGSGATPLTKLTATGADSFRPVWKP